MKRSIKISATIHIAVLLCIIIWPAVFSPRYRHRMHPVHTVQLVSLQEPVVPKTVEPPKPKPKKEKAVVKKIQPIPRPAVEPLKTPGLEKKLSERLKNVESRPASVQEPSASTPQFKATISSTSDFPFQWYLDFIQGKIASSWHQPQMVIAKQYSSMVSFTILKDGTVKNIQIKHPSGMTNFDKSALQAVEQAQPLPQLPPGYKHQQLVVNVEFRLE